MTSTRAKIDLQANSEFHRRIHAESPYWDMMYKAMLDQLTTYVDLAVAEALDHHGVTPGKDVTPAFGASPTAAQTAQQQAVAPPSSRAAASAPQASSPGTPLWLQPFTLPEKVRFTRTPDAILRNQKRLAAEFEPAEEPELPRLSEPTPFDPDMPAWRRPFTLPPNVRINRAPQRQSIEERPDGSAVDTPASEEDSSWLAIVGATTPPGAVQIESLEGGDIASLDDLLADAWAAIHARTDIVPEIAAPVPLIEPAGPEPEPIDDAFPHLFRRTEEAAEIFSLHDMVEALLDHATEARAMDPAPLPTPLLMLAPPPAVIALPPPEPDGGAWLDLCDAQPRPASLSLIVEAAPIRPTGIASPEDMLTFVGPDRGTAKRRTTAPGLGPFQQSSHVISDPALWEDPPIELLIEAPPSNAGDELSSGALEQNARLLEGVLEEFGVRGEIIDVRPGPVVTLYELEPAPGTKSSRVIGLSDDIARSMSAVSARVAVVQGRNVIGIELPNQRRETVYLRELVGSADFVDSKHKLAIALGKTIGGESVIVDLARMPHLLVAGTTGSGKSVAINTMILSILYRLRPEECRLIMIDPKMLELSIYEGIPHLLTPVVTDPKKAVVALKWAVREMEDRYKKMSKVGVRNIDGFNARVAEAAVKGEVITRITQTGFNRETGEPIFETEEMELSPLPYIVVIVDEMADLMMVAGKDIEGAIQRLAQMARAAGIHLIMATQRPSVDVITGTIKANFPTRISFQVTSKIDSRTILGEQGAEQLLGQGDMLYMAGGGRISRVHGPFVSDGEVEKVVAHLKTQGHPAYLDVVVAEDDGGESKAEMADDKPVFERGAMGDEDNDLYEQAVKVVLRDKKCSTSYIQRRLQVGYNKAASLVERMEKEGLVGQANNAGKREILVYSRDLRFTESREGEE